MALKDKRIIVITYNYPHRKTQDTLFHLKAKGFQQVKLLALPFVLRERKNLPIYKHRPSQAIEIDPTSLAKNFDYECELCKVDELKKCIQEYKPYATLIAGAGLLPESLVESVNIINSHPAYLPLVRGLDALKWAIINKEKIGVTTHLIDKEADTGKMIDRKEVPLYEHDTFHSLAYRQYRMEVEMLVEAISYDLSDLSKFKSLPTEGKVNKRMPIEIEKDLLKFFKEYKKSKFSL